MSYVNKLFVADGESYKCFCGTDYSSCDHRKGESMRPMRTANIDILHRLCPDGNHNNRKSFEDCEDCGATLCTLCGSDSHYVSEGHDLNDPRYWGV